jgi:hypothetical protein
MATNWYSLSDYYDEFTGEVLPQDRDELSDRLHEYCDTEASNMNNDTCIRIINEHFGNQLEAIQSYMDEYGEFVIASNINIWYNRLAFLALKLYINDRLPNDYETTDNDNDNDDDDSNASTLNQVG